ncbi:hypothetical protein CCR75_000255 [Bremia lactucae]|uniref:Uncharacterized protein n=1 Tax=Bremia lactucae TaxID=4779 RepID=A0A976FEC5_BRELC|nr:hypothetical protein CCR75_000255 [Bremia lactucae]
MSFALLRRRPKRTTITEGSTLSGETRNDSCPLLGEHEELKCNVQPVRIQNVRRIDNGIYVHSPKESVVMRMQRRKNRIVQRVLVACRLADPSRDQTFEQAQKSNRTEQAEKRVLEKINHRIANLKRIDSLIESRSKLVLDVEYAKRTLAVEQQKGNVNRVAERKQALQAAQLKCEQETRFITEQLKLIRPTQNTDVLELFQEVTFVDIKVNILNANNHILKYAQLARQLFKSGAEVFDTTVEQE